MKSFFIGLIGAFIVFTGYFFLFGTGTEVTLMKVVQGFGYFTISPFYALVFLETKDILFFLAAIIVFVLLFRRVGTCMRPTLMWVAYMLLLLHWLVFGVYSAGFII